MSQFINVTFKSGNNEDTSKEVSDLVQNAIGSRGLNSMSKLEYECLFFWIVYNFGYDSKGNKLSDKKISELSTLLKVNVRKLQQLRSEAVLKFVPNVDEYYIVKFIDLLNKILNNDRLTDEDGDIPFTFDDKGLLNFIDIHLKQNLIEAKNKGNNSNLYIKVESLISLLKHFKKISSPNAFQGILDSIDSVNTLDEIRRMLKRSGKYIPRLLAKMVSNGFI